MADGIRVSLGNVFRELAGLLFVRRSGGAVQIRRLAVGLGTDITHRSFGRFYNLFRFRLRECCLAETGPVGGLWSAFRRANRFGFDRRASWYCGNLTENESSLAF